MLKPFRYFGRSAAANQADLDLIRAMVHVAVESALDGVSGVVGHDEERDDEYGQQEARDELRVDDAGPGQDLQEHDGNEHERDEHDRVLAVLAHAEQEPAEQEDGDDTDGQQRAGEELEPRLVGRGPGAVCAVCGAVACVCEWRRGYGRECGGLVVGVRV